MAMIMVMVMGLELELSTQLSYWGVVQWAGVTKTIEVLYLPSWN